VATDAETNPESGKLELTKRKRGKKGSRGMLEDLYATPRGVKESKELKLKLVFILYFIHLLTVTRYCILMYHELSFAE